MAPEPNHDEAGDEWPMAPVTPLLDARADARAHAGSMPPGMRVLVITRVFPNAVEPLSSPFNRQQFAALGRLCDVEIMATIPWFPGSRWLRRWRRSPGLHAVPACDVIDGLTVVHPRVLYLPKVGAGLSAALEVASLLPEVAARRLAVDVILGSWAYPEGVAAVALGRLLGVPSVIKVHGSDLNVIASMLGPRANLALAMPRAARVVAVSRSLGEKARSLGVASERIAVVPNGVDTSLFHVQDCDAARAELRLPARGAMVLYCGRLERAKGVFDLLAAFLALAPREPSLSLVLLGEGSARREAELMARPLGPRVTFAGARPLAEVPTWMAASTLVTLPSHDEGSPNAVREALACGRPVVATSVGGIPELITSRVLGELVPVRDPCALAQALVAVAHRPTHAGTIAARSGGSWHESAASLLDVLHEARREQSRA